MARKAIGLKFNDDDLVRWDAYAQEHGMTRTSLIETAVEALIGSGVQSDHRLPNARRPSAADLAAARTAVHAPRPGVRRAFICGHETKGVRDCNRRTFLTPDEPDRVPDCAEHGPMQPQPNRPYKGVSTASTDRGGAEA